MKLNKRIKELNSYRSDLQSYSLAKLRTELELQGTVKTEQRIKNALIQTLVTIKSLELKKT